MLLCRGGDPVQPKVSYRDLGAPCSPASAIISVILQLTESELIDILLCMHFVSRFGYIALNLVVILSLVVC